MSEDSNTTTAMSIPTGVDENPTLEQQAAQMEAEQNAPTSESVIPDKFLSAEDPVAAMAKAYAELEKKQSAPLAAEPSELKLEKVDGQADLTGDEIARLGEEYLKNGDLTEDSYSHLARRGITKEVVDMFVSAQVQQAQATRSQVLSEAGIDTASWESMTDWASRNWSEDQVNEWNDLANSSSPLARKLAVENLKGAWTSQGRGPEATRIDGTPSTGGFAAFRSQAEMLEAMKDSRYDEDPAYRGDVDRRIELMLRANQ